MEAWIRYKALVKVYLTTYLSTLFNKRRGSISRDDAKSKTKSVFGGIAIGISFLIIIGILISAVISFTVSAIEQGYLSDIPYLLVGASQLCILLLGGNVMLSYLYFSEDNKLILSLPIRSGEAYAAKYTVAYLSQLFISAFFLPVLIAFGVTASLNGVAVSPLFYVVSVLSVLLLPAFPMFAMGVFSAPLMLLIKLFKNKERAKMLVTVISSALGMILYFAVIFWSSFSGDGENLVSAQSITMMRKIARVFIFNFHFCQALLGESIILNTFFYILECIGGAVLAIVLCGFFFGKILYVMGDSSVAGGRKRIKGDPYRAGSLTKTLFMKDLKLVFKTPTLLFTTVLGIVMCPVMTVLSHRMFGSYEMESDSVYGMELISLGICFYMCFVMLAASNSVSGVSISVEKNNFAVLKTLPVSGAMIVRSKLRVSCLITALICLTSFISFVATSSTPLSPVFGLLLCGAYFLSGCGLSAWEIMRDLEKPNFRFNNVNELTKNNKRMLLPILSATGLGLIVMIAGIAFGSALPDNLLFVGYIVFFVLVYALSIILFSLPYASIRKKADEMYDRLEV